MQNKLQPDRCISLADMLSRYWPITDKMYRHKCCPVRADVTLKDAEIYNAEKDSLGNLYIF